MGKLFKIMVAAMVLCFFSSGYCVTKVYFNGERIYVGEIRVINGIECVLVKGSEPSRFWMSKNPIENVSKNDAADFCKTVGGRLPTADELKSASKGAKGKKFANFLDRTAGAALGGGANGAHDVRDDMADNLNNLAKSLSKNPNGVHVVFDAKIVN